jgi:histidinol dehydrogenase
MEIYIPEIIRWSSLDQAEKNEAIRRPPLPDLNISSSVADIIGQVRDHGDAALIRFGQQFDGADLDQLEVSAEEFLSAESAVEPELLQAIDEAISRIENFHRAGMPKPLSKETAPGLVCEARYLPISPVGLYVPGGSAPLISTVLMLALPARIAACDDVILCTPPDSEGRIAPAILVAAARCGVKRIFKVGGAQAIAGMGLGTATIPACAKLFGPGNAWVTEAKQQISILPDGAARDMPAGPSEVLVMADDSADATAVCWDLLSQAEHGPDSQAIVISDSQELLAEVTAILPTLAAGLPRVAILSESLRHMRQILVSSMQEAVTISNSYAPEHLILNCRGAEELAASVTAAGSVFIGPWTPESLGDYCSGTNHVLPTYGYARAYSGLSVSDFLRRMTLQRAGFEGLKNVGACAMTLAAAEGLDAHRMAVDYRLSQGNEQGDRRA